MPKKQPGKSHRQGISIIELTEMFPDEASAVRWFEEVHWPGRPPLPALRQLGYQGNPERQADALLVP